MNDHFTRNFIDGDWVSARDGNSLEVHHPSCGEAIATVPLSSHVDVARAVEVAGKALERWATRQPQERLRYVLDALALMQRDLGKIVDLEARDTGAPVRYLGKHIAATLDGVRELLRAKPPQASRPPGVVATVLSWSGPFALACREILPALAAGDVFVVKPSTRAPLSAVLFAERLVEAGLPAGVFNIVQGTGNDAGAPLIGQPGLTEVCFQGSRETAQMVGRAAASAKSDVRVCLRRPELTIVDAGADLAAAAAHIVERALFNTGRAGCGTQVAHIQTGLFRSTMDLMEKALCDVRYGSPTQADTSAGPMITEHFRQARRDALAFLDTKDVTPLFLGPQPDRAGWFTRPQILLSFKFDQTAHAELPLGPTIVVRSLPARQELLREGLEETGWNTTAVFDDSGLTTREMHGERFVAL